MDFEEFRERLMEDLKDSLQDRTGKEYTADANHVKKLQNADYDGIVIRPEGEQVGVNLDAQMLFKAYESGKSYDEVVEQATNIVAEGFENQPSFSVEDFSNYDVMKEKLAIQVVSTERNTEMLEKIPHKEVEDMSMVCRFVVGNNENEMGTVLVTNQMLESYGITGEQLFNDAAKYAPELRPSEIKGMADVLAEMMGVDVSELGETMGMPESPELPMYVASTHDKMNGAGIIGYPGFMDMASEKVGGDFFLLPSSVHEVLLIPDDGKTDYRNLESMVREVNATQVELKDQLSDNVYHYDSKEKVFELAEKFDARKKERTSEKGDKEKGSVLKDLDSKKKEISDKPKDKAPKTHKKEDMSL